MYFDIIPLSDIGQSKPTLADLQRIVVPNAADTWFKLGVELLPESSIPKLNGIDKTYPKDPERCCLEMLLYWLEVKPSTTWEAVIQALRSPGLQLVKTSEEVEKKIYG